MKYLINAVKIGRKIIKENKIEIIHSNNFSPALAGSTLSFFTKTPHITTIHDMFSIYDKEFWKKWKKQSNVSGTNARLVPFFEKLMMKFRFNCIHTVSDATKKDIQKTGTKKQINKIPVLKIDRNVGFCRDCGSLIDNISNFTVCEVCDNDDKDNLFIGEAAEKLNAYFKIGYDGLLKKYAKSRGVVIERGHSNKTVAWNLMILDKYFKNGDIEMKNLVNRIFWRRFV